MCVSSGKYLFKISILRTNVVEVLGSAEGIGPGSRG